MKDILKLIEKQPSGAVFDSRRRYRYLLWRNWSPSLPAVSFIMLNPSAADEHYNDPTIARSINLAREGGFGSIFVVNLFAYMTKSPALLKASRYPVTCRRDAAEGRHNDDFIQLALSQSRRTVLAWGNHGSFRERHLEIIEMLRATIRPEDCFVFAMTKEGQPRHPLYTPKSIGLQSAPREYWTGEI